MNIKYDEFKNELENKVKAFTDWLKEIEPGYEGEIDKEKFEEMKSEIRDNFEAELEVAIERFGEYLED